MGIQSRGENRAFPECCIIPSGIEDGQEFINIVSESNSGTKKSSRFPPDSVGRVSARFLFAP